MSPRWERRSERGNRSRRCGGTAFVHKDHNYEHGDINCGQADCWANDVIISSAEDDAGLFKHIVQSFSLSAVEVYPLFAAVGVAVGICGLQLVRNICINPEVRVNKQDRAAEFWRTLQREKSMLNMV
ncbi:hypothetical protein GH714_043303 [Hevea brasiliensis]|uniref:Uncharacterized protein n=1 Tax=Hevea brasiliensis TaxID=3981 RepID=A0A6A6K3K6_HEVBR|nr:hypothetical protein GH714_043303 [Hevea brasiliensis]